ncbi:MAG: S8 family serine peptidase [Methylococcales bacterium]
MKQCRYRVILGATVVMALPGCAQLVGVPNTELPKQMLARQVLVTLPDALKPKWSAIGLELAKQHALTETGEFPLSSIGVDCLVYKVPEQLQLQQVIDKLRSDKRVGLVQENQVFEGIQGAESDAFAAISYAPKLTHATDAHRISTGKAIKIAIIDTGAEKEHPDLKGRIRHTANFVEGGDLSFNRDQHGTAVAGVIGARADDGIGIFGIAPEADINILKACWYPEKPGAKAQCSSWTLAKALDAAINSGARIINLSLAGPNDELMAKLLATAHDRGINIVAAALEQQDKPGFPANLPDTIPVISTGSDGVVPMPVWLSEFPGTVAAPGQDILTTVPREGYDFLSGSSLATGHVSAIIALLLELKPELTPNQIKELLHNNGQSGAADSRSVLDICAIIKALRNGDGC